MSPTAKQAAPDKDVGYFYYMTDLTIDPPLKDAVIKADSSDFLTLKQKKDEDVAFVDGEIKVVSTNITSVTANHKPNQTVSGYDVLKRDAAKLFSVVAANGSTISGYILVRRNGDNDDCSEFFRIVPQNGKAVVQAPVLAFPDGTSLQIPSGEGL